jgi:hypothetical protein
MMIDVSGACPVRGSWRIGLLIAIAACSSPDVEPGQACAASSECPAGYECHPTQRRCLLASDGSVPDAPPTDAPEPDGSASDADARPMDELPDASAPDASLEPADAAAPDAAPPDAVAADATPPDAALPDAAPPDAAPDASLPEEPMPDAAPPDAPLPDAAPPDAPVRDAAPDAAIPDAAAPDAVPTGPVQVTVLAGDGTGLQGALVVFHRLAGASEVLTTPASGTVTASLEEGAMITVARELGSERALMTFVGARPGDALTARAGGQRRTSELVGVLSISPPGANEDAARYVTSSCSPNDDLGIQTNPMSFEAEGPYSYAVHRHCLEGDGHRVVAAALDAGDGPIAFSAGETSVTGGPAELSLGDWTEPSTSMISFANTPAAAQIELLSALLVSGRSHVRVLRATHGGAGPLGPFVAPVPADSASYELVSLVNAMNILPGGAIQFRTARFSSAVAPAIAHNLAELPGAMESVTVENDTTLAVRWTSSAPLTGLSGGRVRLEWDGGARSWDFIIPPGEGELRAPTLPDELSGWAPPTGAALSAFVLFGRIPGVSAAGYLGAQEHVHEFNLDRATLWFGEIPGSP